MYMSAAHPAFLKHKLGGSQTGSYRQYYVACGAEVACAVMWWVCWPQLLRVPKHPVPRGSEGREVLPAAPARQPLAARFTGFLILCNPISYSQQLTAATAASLLRRVPGYNNKPGWAVPWAYFSQINQEKNNTAYSSLHTTWI